MRVLSTPLFVFVLIVGSVSGQTTTLVSVASDGTQATQSIIQMALSADGRTAVLSSFDSTLVPGDTNNLIDIFVHDLTNGTTRRINLRPDGSQSMGFPTGSTFWAEMASADGRFIVFDSSDTEMVPEKNSVLPDIFVHDRDTDGNGIFDEEGKTSNTRVSVSSGGAEAQGFSKNGTISGNGRFVAFESGAQNLDGPTGGSGIFVHARDTGLTTLVSKSSQGTPGNSVTDLPTISHTGRHIAFVSAADNLVEDDNNGPPAFPGKVGLDIFVRDQQTDETVRVSVASDGSEGNGDATNPAISGNGRYVVFISDATNLVEGDTNGEMDVFLHDRDADGNGVFDEAGGISTTRVNLTPDGSESDRGAKWAPSISPNGRYIGFPTNAGDLVSDDTNGIQDAFVLDRDIDENGIFDEPGKTMIRRVNVGPGGGAGQHGSGRCRQDGQSAYDFRFPLLQPRGERHQRDFCGRRLCFSIRRRTANSDFPAVSQRRDRCRR